jgi:hypothetical protein
LKPLRIVTFVSAALLLTGAILAQDEYDDFGPKPTGGEKTKKKYEADLADHKGNDDILVLPGLVANRNERRVEVVAESTGLRGGELAEFLLIDQGSSHGYEALLWSFAKPSDVHRALEFIGLKPGTPFNPNALRFWADGARVKLSVDDDTGKPFPIERFILDNNSENTLPEEGFVFSGSVMVDPRDGTSGARYAADVYDPRSVASVYNEPTAVLDVPRRVSQGEVYGSLVVNPDCAFEAGKLLTIVMEPADPDGQTRTRHLTLSISNAVDSVAVGSSRIDTNSTPDGETYHLRDSNGKAVCEDVSLSAVFASLKAMREEGLEPYAELSFGEGLTIDQLRKVCAVVAVLEMAETLRVKEPPAGQPYYRAFVPDTKWRTPEERPSQPWELHLSQAGGKILGRFILNDPVWGDDSLEPTFKQTVLEACAPPDLRGRLDAAEQKRLKNGKTAAPAVLFVFADRDLTYGKLMDCIGPLLKTHGTLHVFVEE